MMSKGEIMSTEPTPVRKKPTVRKSSAHKDSDSLVRPGEPLTKKITLKKANSGLSLSPEKTLVGWQKAALLMFLSALVSSLLTYAIMNNSNTAGVPKASASAFSDVIAGKVALTESELISAVQKVGKDVYWAGPVKNAKYTLAVPAEGQAYVRYLPNGQGLSDTKPNYVVIATYTTADAFKATQAAGNTSNGVTFINAEGAAVYYNKSTPTNVYVAYANKNYQIEIFDPIAATALEIASKAGALRLVK